MQWLKIHVLELARNHVVQREIVNVLGGSNESMQNANERAECLCTEEIVFPVALRSCTRLFLNIKLCEAMSWPEYKVY